MEIRLDSLKPYIDETIQKAVNDVKKDFIEAMRANIMKLQTYKMFPYEDTVYVERDEVMKIFEKYTEGESKDADSD